MNNEYFWLVTFSFGFGHFRKSWQICHKILQISILFSIFSKQSRNSDTFSPLTTDTEFHQHRSYKWKKYWKNECLKTHFWNSKKKDAICWTFVVWAVQKSVCTNFQLFHSTLLESDRAARGRSLFEKNNVPTFRRSPKFFTTGHWRMQPVERRKSEGEMLAQSLSSLSDAPLSQLKNRNIAATERTHGERRFSRKRKKTKVRRARKNHTTTQAMATNAGARHSFLCWKHFLTNSHTQGNGGIRIKPPTETAECELNHPRKRRNPK